jgi:rhodanese-related sulfurtransferase
MCGRTQFEIRQRASIEVCAHAHKRVKMTTLIDRAELKELIDNRAVAVIDALPDTYYQQQHLPTAINLVESDVNEQAAELLPDKEALIVTYCSNAACPNSQAVANRLSALGYSNVRKYREGIQDWVTAGLPTEGTMAVA